MVNWPLSEKQWKSIEDALESRFGKKHYIGLICDSNAGYVAYSESINGGTRTTINVSDTTVLSIMVDEYAESIAEHEYLHVHGVGKQYLTYIDPPEATPSSLRDTIGKGLTERVLDLAKCTNVVFQQEMAKEYVEFECRKTEYTYSEGESVLRAEKLMTYGYLDALSKHFGVRCFTRRNRFDIVDIAILRSTEALITALLELRNDAENVYLFDLCANLNSKIRHQKNVLDDSTI